MYSQTRLAGPVKNEEDLFSPGTPGNATLAEKEERREPEGKGENRKRRETTSKVMRRWEMKLGKAKKTRERGGTIFQLIYDRL